MNSNELHYDRQHFYIENLARTLQQNLPTAFSDSADNAHPKATAAVVNACHAHFFFVQRIELRCLIW